MGSRVAGGGDRQQDRWVAAQNVSFFFNQPSGIEEIISMEQELIFQEKHPVRYFGGDPL